VPSFGAKIGVTIASPVFVFIWRQLDLFVSEEPDMVAIGVKFRELLAAYGAKQLIPPERPRLLIQREKAPPPVSPTKEQIEPLLRAGMSAGEIAKQFGVAPYVVTNAVCRQWQGFVAASSESASRLPRPEVPRRIVERKPNALRSGPNVQYVVFESFLLALIPTSPARDEHMFSLNLCGKGFSVVQPVHRIPNPSDCP